MIAWAANRPAAVWSAAVGLVLAGAVAFSRLPLATRPVVELPRLDLSASWPGATAELVEKALTAPLEAAVQSVRGVRRVDSESFDGASRVTIHLQPDADVQLTRLAIHERLEVLRPELPLGAGSPSLANYVPSELAEQPLLRYTVYGPHTPGTLAQLLEERLQPVIASVPGVGSVDVSGGAQLGVSIAYDRALLARVGVAPEAISEALRASRLVRSLGEEVRGSGTFAVVLRNELRGLEDLASLPIRAAGGRTMRLGELASVRPEEDSRDQFYRINGQPAVAISVQRAPNADAIRTASAVRGAVAAAAERLPPGVSVRLQRDESESLRESLSNLALRGAVATLAVLLVLALTLRSVHAVALVFGSAVVAIAGTASSLYVLGVSANLLTLAGLAMGIGILVQNGVVVVDRLRSVPDDAAARAAAAHRIAAAVVGATLTTAVVLLPFLFLQGNARAAFTPFAIAFALALGWSVVASLVVVPAVARSPLGARAAWRRLDRGYRWLAVRLLRWRWATVAVGAAAVGVVAWGFVRHVPKSSWSWWWGQPDQLYASLEFPRGSDPRLLDEGIREFESIVVGRPGVEQAVARGSRDGAQLVVSFTDQPGVTPYVLEEELTRRGVLIGGAAVAVRYQGPGFYSGGLGGSPINQRIKLLGYSYDELERIALDLKRRLERIPRVRDVSITSGSFWMRERAFGIVLRPDRAALARFGLTAEDLAAALGREAAGAVGGERFVVGGEEVLVLVKDAGARSRTLDKLRAAIVPTALGTPVRIGDVAEVSEEETLGRISRQDQQYVRILSYDFRGPPRLAERTHRSFMRSITLPPGYSASDDRFSWQEDDSARSLWLVSAIGVALVVLAVAL
ncbi:MAG TPA: efflux RND transporter permease subunit, partial [Gemmatimonadales bacterium]|nr:efflux RND transporter permease subunit [Gemmatimonadales bacterium]